VIDKLEQLAKFLEEWDQEVDRLKVSKVASIKTEEQVEIVQNRALELAEQARNTMASYSVSGFAIYHG